MTATCSTENIDASQHIFGFNIIHKDWPTGRDMANSKQSFFAIYTPVAIKYIYNTIESHLGISASDASGHPLPDKNMIYGNTRDTIKKTTTKIENFLDIKDGLSKFDVLVIHGHQSKEEKSAYLRHFSTCNGKKKNVKIACATSKVASAGIDCKDVRFVFRIDLLPPIWDLAQEMGRAGRGPFATGNDYKYFLFFKLADLIYLYLKICNPNEHVMMWITDHYNPKSYLPVLSF